MAHLHDLPFDIHCLIALYVDDERPWRKEFHIVNLLKVNRYWGDVARFVLLTQGKKHYRTIKQYPEVGCRGRLNTVKLVIA